MATQTTTGFALGCPHCGATEALTIKVSDLAVECGDCGETITRDDLNRAISEAQRLLRWLDLAATA